MLRSSSESGLAKEGESEEEVEQVSSLSRDADRSGFSSLQSLGAFSKRFFRAGSASRLRSGSKLGSEE